MAGACSGGGVLDHPAAAQPLRRGVLDHHPAPSPGPASRHRGPQPGSDLHHLDRPARPPRRSRRRPRRRSRRARPRPRAPTRHDQLHQPGVVDDHDLDDPVSRLGDLRRPTRRCPISSSSTGGGGSRPAGSPAARRPPPRAPPPRPPPPAGALNPVLDAPAAAAPSRFSPHWRSLECWPVPGHRSWCQLPQLGRRCVRAVYGLPYAGRDTSGWHREETQRGPAATAARSHRSRSRGVGSLGGVSRRRRRRNRCRSGRGEGSEASGAVGVPAAAVEEGVAAAGDRRRGTGIRWGCC